MPSDKYHPISYLYLSIPPKCAFRIRSHSHSTVAGGLDEMSYVTRFTPLTSFVMREEIRFRTSGGKTYLSRCHRRVTNLLRAYSPVGRHEILSLHRTQRNDLAHVSVGPRVHMSRAHLLVRSFVPHHSHCLDGE